MTDSFVIPYPKDLLPHRDPMLLIDEIDDYQPGKSIRVINKINPESVFFKGHFPNEPIMPGVILVEMMFQACGIFGRLETLYAQSLQGLELTVKKPTSARAIKIEHVSFMKPVFPNDIIIITAEPKQKLFNFSVFNAKIEIQDKGVAAKGVVTVLINT